MPLPGAPCGAFRACLPPWQWSRTSSPVRVAASPASPAALTDAAVLPEAKDYAELRQKFDWTHVLPEYFNIGWSCCDRHALAPASRSRPAIIHHLHSGKSRTVTFGELKESSDKLANAMVHGLNLTKGDRVGILMPQRPETALAHMATYKSACIAVPLFTLFGLDALQFRLQNSGCKVRSTAPPGRHTCHTRACLSGHALHTSHMRTHTLSWSLAALLAARDVGTAEFTRNDRTHLATSI